MIVYRWREIPDIPIEHAKLLNGNVVTSWFEPETGVGAILYSIRDIVFYRIHANERGEVYYSQWRGIEEDAFENL